MIMTNLLKNKRVYLWTYLEKWFIFKTCWQGFLGMEHLRPWRRESQSLGKIRLKCYLHSSSCITKSPKSLTWVFHIHFDATISLSMTNVWDFTEAYKIKWWRHFWEWKEDRFETQINFCKLTLIKVKASLPCRFVNFAYMISPKWCGMGDWKLHQPGQQQKDQYWDQTDIYIFFKYLNIKQMSFQLSYITHIIKYYHLSIYLMVYPTPALA